MSSGSVADFLKFAAEREDVQRDLVELAAKHNFTFTSGELSEKDLDQVAGGRILVDRVWRGTPPAHF